MVLGTRRLFDSALGIPSHPAMDMDVYDVRAALALERLGQDRRIGAELAQTTGRIVYKAAIENESDGCATRRMWRLKTVEDAGGRMWEIERQRRQVY